MMGERQTLQRSLFYEFSLEDHVPEDHLLRSIDRLVDPSDIRLRLEPFYSRIGRPSIDPELMLRMLIIGYSHGIRSERRLCQDVRLNLAYRWFCGLDLNDPVPDHSTFSKKRHGRFRDCDLFRLLFEDVLARCIQKGLVGGEAFGVDASLIKADANREDGIAPDDWAPGEHASRATSEYLATLDDAAFGAATPVQPKYLSPVDPAARWSAADRDKAQFIYSTNYLAPQILQCGRDIICLFPRGIAALHLGDHHFHIRTICDYFVQSIQVTGDVLCNLDTAEASVAGDNQRRSKFFNSG